MNDRSGFQDLDYGLKLGHDYGYTGVMGGLWLYRGHGGIMGHCGNVFRCCVCGVV